MHPVEQAYVLFHQPYGLSSDLADVSDYHTDHTDEEYGEYTVEKLSKNKADWKLLVEGERLLDQ